MDIRQTRTDELEAILALYPLAFPEEELRPLVTELLKGDAELLSLAAFDGGTLIAHVIFTLFQAGTTAGKGALLGPLGVLPIHQGQGVGTALAKHGLKRLENQQVAQVFVLGDPAYYGRFGFTPERHVLPPYPLPEDWTDAWQSVLLDGHTPLPPGLCVLPSPWMEPALWGP